MNWRDRFDTLEHGAWHETGRRHNGTIVGIRLFVTAFPFLLLAALIGGLGYMAKRGWDAVTDGGGVSLPGAGSAGRVIASQPLLLWAAVLVLIVGTLWTVAPGRYPTPPQRALRAGITLIALAGLLGFWLAIT